jgi:hypothetical protein
MQIVHWPMQICTVVVFSTHDASRDLKKTRQGDQYAESNY